ncbi:MAG: hypothetical protein HY581_02415 [Nitrospirae bacterium]|nr:hypothetical protein [Nitrospirota bacterium]
MRVWYRTACLAGAAGSLLLLVSSCTKSIQPQSNDGRPALELMLMRANGNPYLEDRIKSSLHQMEQELADGLLKTQLVNTTPEELLRGIENTRQGDSIYAVDYGIDWEGTDFNEYLLANLKAADRGVKITRVFIISDKQPPRELCKVMKRQLEAGIAVRIAEKDKLTPYREYQESRKARIIFQYQNKHSVLMIETIPFPDLKLGEPYLLDVTWGNQKVDDSKKYVDWLTNEERSKAFDPSRCGP